MSEPGGSAAEAPTDIRSGLLIATVVTGLLVIAAAYGLDAAGRSGVTVSVAVKVGVGLELFAALFLMERRLVKRAGREAAKEASRAFGWLAIAPDFAQHPTGWTCERAQPSAEIHRTEELVDDETFDAYFGTHWGHGGDPADFMVSTIYRCGHDPPHEVVNPHPRPTERPAEFGPDD